MCHSGSHCIFANIQCQGYHVQVTARTDRDLTPEGIIRKVSDASGSKYSGDTSSRSEDNAATIPLKPKPAFTPTQAGGASKSFAPLGSRSRNTASQDADADEDGWGADAPRTTRTQLEKVTSAYKPTKVNMAELTSQKTEPSRFQPKETSLSTEGGDVVRGGYQPIGKVDIAAIRRQAQGGTSANDDRPAPVKGSYEPIGKVDIAAIRARAQPSADSGEPPSTLISSAKTGGSAAGDEDQPKSLADRSAAFTQSDRMTSMPKPKVANRFGSSNNNFTGTRAPAPTAFQSKVNPTSAPIGTANKNFAEEGGKTPAQLWAERKARERGNSGASTTAPPASSRPPIASQPSGNGQWESGYAGKKWGAVSTTKTGQSAASDVAQEESGDFQEREEPASPAGNISSMRDRFKNAAPIGMGRPPAMNSRGYDEEREEEEEEESAPLPPRMNMTSKPNAGPAGRVAIPGMARPPPPVEDEEEQEQEDEPARLPTPPPQPPRSPTPPTPTGSPIRVAMPISRSKIAEMEPPEERFAPPPMPAASMAQALPPPRDLEDEPQVEAHDPARAAGMAAAVTSFGAGAVSHSGPGANSGGKRAVAQFDYEKAEDNELELREGEEVINIEMVDDDWWMGENSRGEKGLFPSNYVELVEGGADDEEEKSPQPPRAPAAAAAPSAPAASTAGKGPTAIAQFDYEAAEENELSFPEGAKITSLVCAGP